MRHLEQTLPDMIENNHRILIFSQFPSFLSHIQALLNKQNFPFLYIDGQTKNRQKLVDEFQDGDIPIFLISLKAGGTGLNLTAADTVIHMDPWWNPAVENQASDRAHRIGQKRSVSVYKYIVKESIEEKILILQEKKKALFEQVLSGSNKGKLSAEDIRFIFE
ncbi:MAG: C-terminal helicase domain-containing protein [Patescibacteria group bacterium]|nr:C-terminal helicase domain-containing protein [Patescibacteria group bacterium]